MVGIPGMLHEVATRKIVEPFALVEINNQARYWKYIRLVILVVVHIVKYFAI